MEDKLLETYIRNWFKQNRPDFNLKSDALENIVASASREMSLANPNAHVLIVNEFLNNNFSYSVFTLIKTVFQEEYNEYFEKFQALGILNREIDSIMVYLTKNEKFSNISLESFFDENIRTKVKNAIDWNLN